MHESILQNDIVVSRDCSQEWMFSSGNEHVNDSSDMCVVSLSKEGKIFNMYKCMIGIMIVLHHERISERQQF